MSAPVRDSDAGATLLAGEWPGIDARSTMLAVPRLADRAVLRFSGSAARDFLGRQLTCDLALLHPGTALTGAWLTPKGRALALLQLVDSGDGTVHAILPAALADEVCKRMTLFVMRDDVAISRHPELAVAGLAGEAVAVAGSACDTAGMPCVASLGGDVPLALLIGEPDALNTILDAAFAGGAIRGDDNDWRRLAVTHGRAEISAETREEFIPQMLNLDRIGAVSFSKGCYPGQEIVARTQHLGRIKRRMFRALASTPTAPAPGTVIHAGGDRGAVGRVVIGAAGEGDHGELLAVITLDAAASTDPLHLDDAEGPALTLFAPPYPLED